jgi:ubiquinone/menaquinone biosynthesis C-methylase UbiE
MRTLAAGTGVIDLMEWVNTVLIALLVVGLVGLAWWLLITTEGVYLGRRVVIWLYDLYATRYDRIKDFQPDYDDLLLAQPILGAIDPQLAPLVLDVATGSGRLPLALLNNPVFQGRVIGVDLSRRMLRVAAEKLLPTCDRVSLIWSPAETLPFDDNLFDVVTCLEALEFMINRQQVLEELLRVLRPGGILLISNRINSPAMVGKTWTDAELKTLLQKLGMELVEIEPWQVEYQRVWALKAGESLPTGAIPLGEILRCPHCSNQLMVQQENAWICEKCGGQAPISEGGIIELNPLFSSSTFLSC